MVRTPSSLNPELNIYIQYYYGTGSYPLPPHGLHLSIRQMARANPLIGPCLRIACRAYSEQVGVKRHEGGVKGEMNWR